MTLTEVLVAATTVLVLIVLIVLIVPLGQRSCSSSHQQRCGKNQSQLMGSCVAYAQQEAIAWPAPWANTIGYVHPGQAISAGMAAMNYTFGCFGALAWEATLPNGIFRCPQCRTPGPNTRAQPGGDIPEPSGNNWADHGGGSSTRISYAFDWAAANDAGPGRIIFSARDLTNHRGKGVMVCFGDSPTKFLTSQHANAQPALAETIGMEGSAVVGGKSIAMSEMRVQRLTTSSTASATSPRTRPQPRPS